MIRAYINATTKAVTRAVIPGSKSNYLKLFRDYKTRVEDDGGSIMNEQLVIKIYRDLPAQDNIVLSWIAGSGSKNDGIFAEKLYSLHGEIDITQENAAYKPHNVHGVLSNPNKGANYMSHDSIGFLSNQPWSVTTVLNWNGSIADTRTAWAGRRGTAISSLMIHKASALLSLAYRNYDNIDSVISEKSFSYNNIGVNLVLTFIADGSGNMEAMVNGESAGNLTDVDTRIDFNSILDAHSTVARIFDGKFLGHIIRSGALRQEDAVNEHEIFSSLFSEYVEIDSMGVAKYNIEIITTGNKTTISEASDAADWQTGAARWCYHNNDIDNGAVYHKLYNKAARDLIVANPPDGWHVATESELTDLAALGGNALKATGVGYWETADGTNSSGFNAVGGSSRNTDGSFNTIKETASFWCADSDKVLKLQHDSDIAEIVAAAANEGHSIRLISDLTFPIPLT